jgi:hypothetical protein
MKAKLEIVYEDTDRNRPLTVIVSTDHYGEELTAEIDAAVDRAIGNDKDWTQWNLLDITP